MKKFSLSFVIPVYNEEKRIIKTINALKKGYGSIPSLKLSEVIFVNDGSKDKTLEKLKNEKSSLEKKLNSDVIILSYKKNRGKGYAIKKGMQYASSDYTLFFDADMSTPLTEIKKFMPSINNAEDVIIGTRKNGKSTVVIHQPLIREKMGKVFTYLAQVILNTWVTDFTCGFKMFSKKSKNDIFKRSLVERWGYDAELMFIARKLDYEIQEIPVIWSDDHRSKVNVMRSAITSFFELLEVRGNQMLGKYKFSYSWENSFVFGIKELLIGVFIGPYKLFKLESGNKN